VLTDVLMPVMDGIELIREIRRIDPLAKIVAMSGGTRDAAWCPLRVASLLGANRILEKPFDAKVLTAAVSDLLAAPRAVAADAPLPVRPNPGAYRFAKGTPVPRWFGEYASTVAEWGADVIVEVTETDAVARAADQPLAPGEFIIRGRSA
jgi:DNA-binding NtrC family response regulator